MNTRIYRNIALSFGLGMKGLHQEEIQDPVPRSLLASLFKYCLYVERVQVEYFGTVRYDILDECVVEIVS